VATVVVVVAKKKLKKRRAPVSTVLLPETEIERIEQWRAEELERAGYEPRAAATIAARHDIDLHRAGDLLKQGCPPELALQILL
jgi:hypothetical protein